MIQFDFDHRICGHWWVVAASTVTVRMRTGQSYPEVGISIFYSIVRQQWLVRWLFSLWVKCNQASMFHHFVLFALYLKNSQSSLSIFIIFKRYNSFPLWHSTQISHKNWTCHNDGSNFMVRPFIDRLFLMCIYRLIGLRN